MGKMSGPLLDRIDLHIEVPSGRGGQGPRASGDGRPGPVRAAHDRILRVARTIADLGGSADIGAEHVVEVISYRSMDRKLWMR